MKKTKLVTMLGAISLIGAIGAGSTFAYLTSTTGTVTNTGTGYGRCGSSYFEWRYQYGESVSGRKSISGDKQYRYGCG